MYDTKDKAIIFSLRVYREMRQKILKDTENKYVDLYLGLHSKNTVREIYIDRYNLMWLLAHFDHFQTIMERNDITVGKKIYREIFAKSYASFLKDYGKMVFNVETAFKVLKNNQKVLEQMIDTSVSWEQGFEEMRLQKKKFDEEYHRLVEEGIL